MHKFAYTSACMTTVMSIVLLIKLKGDKMEQQNASDDPQCTEIAGVEYGQELRCCRLAGHDGKCE